VTGSEERKNLIEILQFGDLIYEKTKQNLAIATLVTCAFLSTQAFAAKPSFQLQQGYT